MIPLSGIFSPAQSEEEESSVSNHQGGNALPRFKVADPRCEIYPAERDRKLLSAGSWPLETAEALQAGSPDSLWEVRGQHLFRRISVCDEGVDPCDEEHEGRHPMWEALLRFPNASLYATHEPPEKPFHLDPWPNLHTMRVLGMGDKEPCSQEHPTPIKHIYLLHNGLNETTDLLFHYRLAAWILNKRPDAVCILRPLPGHLTRYPIDGPYASKPLDDYLRDPADLFRQFLRYVLETQWLLSTLVPRSQYPVSAGTLLLREASPRAGKQPRRTGRADDKKLAEAMAESWKQAFESNVRGKASGYSEEHVTEPTVLAVINELRELLGWKPVLTTGPPRVLEPESPCIHVVGYSMGGFMAQAIFFAWPFAISSCTNMFAGGALRDLAPTAFAHPEEWQAVLHGLRYQLDSAFRGDLLSSRDGLIAGVEQSVFGYFTRIFYEVFLQYYHGGYASRVSEFSRRLLFVVGGDDPIVRTKNVLDAGPPQGMTLLQIADVSHFPGGRGDAPDGGKVESEQRSYWLPEVGRVIANFSERAEVLLNRTLADSWGVFRGGKATKGRGLSGSPSPLDEGRDRGALDSASFAKELEAVIKCVSPKDPKKAEGDGWLLIGRNEVPPAFLEQKAYVAYAQAVHHSEDEITSYINVLRDRAKWLEEYQERVTLLVPRQCRDWFHECEERERFFAKSETASSARVPDEATAAGMWNYFEEKWLSGGGVGMVTTREYDLESLGPLGRLEAERLKIDRLAIGSLPDAWIALSGTVCNAVRGSRKDLLKVNREAIMDLVIELAEGWKDEEAGAGGRLSVRGKRKAAEPGDGDEVRGIDRLEEWIAGGHVRAVMVSGAELNSRYRGRRLRKAKDVRKALIHWALGFHASDLGGAGDGS
jgi:pimeloyl-ACP methyl ester carboxylesterase